MNRRNVASRGALFDRLLAEHRTLHDLSKPLVRADYDHALDTWQWTLRLDPDAGLAVQLAALFHDIERLESEADARVEQQAADYQTFKDAHAERGAVIADAVLARAGVDEETRRPASTSHSVSKECRSIGSRIDGSRRRPVRMRAVFSRGFWQLAASP